MTKVDHRPFQTKNDGGNPQTEKVVREFMGAFEEYKTTNDTRLKDLEKKGGTDPLLAEKLTRIDKVLDGFEDLNKKATLAESTKAAQDALTERFDRLETALKRGGKGIIGDETKSRVGDWARAVVDSYTMGVPNLSQIQQKTLTEIGAEYKALNIGTDTQGGYLAPIEFVREILKSVTEISAARSLVRVRNTASKSIQIPKRTGTFAARRIGEGATKTETTGLTYGLEELVAPEIYALVDITNDMLEDAAFDMQSEIETEATEQFAVKEGQEFVSGTGVGEAEGILVNGNVGFTVSGAATAITADGIITLKHDIKTDYTRNATFILNRTVLGSVRKLKDTTGAYIWMPGIAAGKPNTIDGDPYVEMPDMPAEGAGTFPIAYGDFKRGYTMLDRIAMEMLRDPFTQATNGRIRFSFRRRSGGKVTMAEAIRKLKCST